MNLPYLTTDQPGIGGQLKTEPEDFLVEEIPLYQPSGEGQHVYVEIEKRGLSTYVAVKKIARALKIPPAAIGYAIANLGLLPDGKTVVYQRGDQDPRLFRTAGYLPGAGR